MKHQQFRQLTKLSIALSLAFSYNFPLDTFAADIPTGLTYSGGEFEKNSDGYYWEGYGATMNLTVTEKVDILNGNFIADGGSVMTVTLENNAILSMDDFVQGSESIGLQVKGNSQAKVVGDGTLQVTTNPKANKSVRSQYKSAIWLYSNTIAENTASGETTYSTSLKVVGVNLELVGDKAIRADNNSSFTLSNKDNGGYLYIGTETDGSYSPMWRGIEANEGGSLISIQTGELKIYSSGLYNWTNKGFPGIATLINTGYVTDSTNESLKYSSSISEISDATANTYTQLGEKSAATINIDADTYVLKAKGGNYSGYAYGIMSWSWQYNDSIIHLSGGKFDFETDWLSAFFTYASVKDSTTELDFSGEVRINSAQTAIDVESVNSGDAFFKVLNSENLYVTSDSNDALDSIAGGTNTLAFNASDNIIFTSGDVAAYFSTSATNDVSAQTTANFYAGNQISLSGKNGGLISVVNGGTASISLEPPSESGQVINAISISGDKYALRLETQKSEEEETVVAEFTETEEEHTTNGSSAISNTVELSANDISLIANGENSDGSDHVIYSLADNGTNTVMITAGNDVTLQGNSSGIYLQSIDDSSNSVSVESGGNLKISTSGVAVTALSDSAVSKVSLVADEALTFSSATTTLYAKADSDGNSNITVQGSEVEIVNTSESDASIKAETSDQTGNATISVSGTSSLSIVAKSTGLIATAQGTGAIVSMDSPALTLDAKSGTLAQAVDEGRIYYNIDRTSNSALTENTSQLTGFVSAQGATVTDDDGNVSTQNGGQVYVGLGTAESWFKGGTKDGSFKSEETAGQISIHANNGATWYVYQYQDGDRKADSELYEYVSEGPSNVDLTYEDQAQNLNIYSLKGNNAQFHLRSVVDENRTGENRDHINIQSGTGSHSILVKAVGVQKSDPLDWEKEVQADYLVQHYEQNGATSALIDTETGESVMENTTDLSFELANDGKAVDLGNYKYVLRTRDAKDDDNNKIGTEWYLARVTVDTPSNVEEDDDDCSENSCSSISSVRPPKFDELSSAAQAVTTLASQAPLYSAWMADLTDLRKRLGEVRYGAQDGLWARVISQKDKISGIAGGQLRQKLYGLQFGLDRIVTQNEDRLWMVGANFKYNVGDQKVYRMQYGHGDLRSYGGFLYATYANQKGYYTDLVLSLDSYRQKLSAEQTDYSYVHGKYNTWGWGASVETGKMFSFDQNDEGWGPWYNHWWIEPQVQLSYYWIKGKNFTLDNGMTVNQKNGESLVGRLGVVIGKKFNYGSDRKAVDKRYSQFYLKGGVKQEFLGKQTLHINGEKFSDKLRGTRVYYGAGFDWNVSDQLRLYAQVERENGHKYQKDYQVSVGLKWQF